MPSDFIGLGVSHFCTRTVSAALFRLPSIAGLKQCSVSISPVCVAIMDLKWFSSPCLLDMLVYVTFRSHHHSMWLQSLLSTPC